MEYTKDEPVLNLKSYLHSKIVLSPAFDPSIDPMLIAKILAAKYTSLKNGDGVNDIAYWVDEGFGYFTKPGKDKEDLDVEHIDEILPSRMIGLDADGFFNNVPSNRTLHFTKGSVIIPFSKADFLILKVTAPEAEALANCILAELKNHEVVIANMNKLVMEERLKIFEQIYGKEIWQHFSQKQLADYTGITVSYLSRLKTRE
ncbi:cyclic nucleotide-binding domain-containing protein [Pedobacter frigoris]|uniref:Crp/Fnr family transcriptional regulator n=1 Tax=Pedobacter frigoris TaxID=2571272 RepID=A0A4U1CTG2_9SPHI|nr:Crp/Fnr family transcriptional regulator [Pedobacter frigoris]TKC09249.1 Crp/Fnr family transcriptional regulator [Pedobacter frigoris]